MGRLYFDDPEPVRIWVFNAVFVKDEFCFIDFPRCALYRNLEGKAVWEVVDHGAPQRLDTLQKRWTYVGLDVDLDTASRVDVWI